MNKGKHSKKGDNNARSPAKKGGSLYESKFDKVATPDYISILMRSKLSMGDAAYQQQGLFAAHPPFPSQPSPSRTPVDPVELHRQMVMKILGVDSLLASDEFASQPQPSSGIPTYSLGHAALIKQRLGYLVQPLPRHSAFNFIPSDIVNKARVGYTNEDMLAIAQTPFARLPPANFVHILCNVEEVVPNVPHLFEVDEYLSRKNHVPTE